MEPLDSPNDWKDPQEIIKDLTHKLTLLRRIAKIAAELYNEDDLDAALKEAQEAGALEE